MPTVIQVRRDTAAGWTSAGTTLAAGEIGYETDTGNFKVGDGTNGWTALAYQMPYINTGSLTNGKTSTVKETLVVNHETDRVGIGTATPAQKLDVVGTAAISSNTTVGGTLNVTGATTLTGDLAVNAPTNADITTTTTTATVFNTNATTLNIGGAATAVSIGAATGTTTINNTNTAITGSLALATNKLTVAASTGNTAIAGTLGVASDLAVATNKFTVAAASGNTVVAGTIGVAGNVAVNTDKFNITAASGNTTIAGTLGVTGATTFNASTGAPTYAADPSSADILSRKSYVDSRTRVGAVVVITHSALITQPIIGGVFNAGIASPGLTTVAGLSGVPSGWNCTVSGTTVTVQTTGGTWYGTFFHNDSNGNVAVHYAYQTGTSISTYISANRGGCLILVRTA